MEEGRKEGADESRHYVQITISYSLQMLLKGRNQNAQDVLSQNSDRAVGSSSAKSRNT